MRSLVTIIITGLIIWLLVLLSPIIFAVFLILIGIVVIFSFYVKHKIRKQGEQIHEYSYTFTTDEQTSNHKGNNNGDVIDVEFTESTQREDYD